MASFSVFAEGSGGALGAVGSGLAEFRIRWVVHLQWAG